MLLLSIAFLSIPQLSVKNQKRELCFSDLNDDIDMELREMLNKFEVGLHMSMNEILQAKDGIQKCIKRRIDYMCSMDG